MRGLLWALPALFTTVSYGAVPQTSTNVVATAGDAFGITLGPESLGLYSPSSVRGFNPLSAGNARVDGLYFDQQGSMIDRLVNDTRIRVGLVAVNFPWPAPSGIVDYSLRQAKQSPWLTSIAYLGPYDSWELDIDGSTNFLEKKVGLAAGGSYQSSVAVPGQTAHISSVGILPRWDPWSTLSICAFWGRQHTTSLRPQPVIYLSEGQSPPPVPTSYIGLPWAELDEYSEHYGIVTKLQLPGRWSVRAGLFHSIHDVPRSYSELYLNALSPGLADHVLVAEPDQFYGSTSGEIQLSHTIERQTWRQVVVLGARGRSVTAQYGGAETLDLGLALIEKPRPLPQPDYTFESTTSDRIHEYSAGVSYSLQWLEHINLTAAVRRDNYSNRVSDPSGGDFVTSYGPWLPNASLLFLPTKQLGLFGALTRGLEDSGVAPSSAVNRGQVLNATRSSQKEVGIRYSATSSLSLVAAAFDINRTYFGPDEHGYFSELGEERHRGVELSLAGQVTSRLHIVAGALLMSPEVTTTRATQQPIGIRPVGLANRTEQLALDYQAPWFPSLSVDCVVSSRGRRPASVDNSVKIPGYTTLDFGARYHMTLGQHSATLRLQVLNITNTLNWFVQGDGGLESLPPRRAWAYYVVDL